MKLAIHRGDEVLPTLMIFSFLLFIITALIAPRIDMSSDMFLYVKSLPVTYWIGLALSVTALIWRRGQSGFVVVCSTMLIICYLFVLPSIIYVNYAGSADAYGHMSRSLYILQTGYIQGVGVDAFPGSYILTGILMLVTKVNPLYLLKAWNAAYMGFMALMAYVLAKGVRGDTYIAPLAILALYWSGMYFGKSTYGYMLWATFWLILLMLRERHEAKITLLAILVYIGLTISHPLPSLLIPPIIILYGILGRFLRKKLELKYALPFLLAVVWISWNVVTGLFTKPIADALIHTYEVLTAEFHRPGSPYEEYIGQYTSEYLKVIYLRVFSSLFEIVTGGMASIMMLKRGLDRALLPSIGFLFLALLFVSPWSGTSLANLNRAVELSLMLYAPLLSIYIGLAKMVKDEGVRITKHLIHLLGFVLIIFIFLMPITSYTSSMPFMHIPAVSQETSKFLVSYGDVNPIYGLKLNRPFIAIEFNAFLTNSPSSKEWYVLDESSSHLLITYPNSINNLRNYGIVITGPIYFVLDKFRYFYPNFTIFVYSVIQYLNSDSQFDVIYSNSPHSMIYLQKR